MDNIKEILTWIAENKGALIPIIFSIIGVATSISKLTPNKTDNKWVGYIAKIVQIFAVHAKPTELQEKKWKL